MRVAEAVRLCPTTAAKRLTLGIALGSGSARGWAHVGVLGARRAGYRAGLYRRVLDGSDGRGRRCRWSHRTARDLGAFARLEGDRRAARRRTPGRPDQRGPPARVLSCAVRYCQFADLPLPFAAVATDLASGEEVWLREGRVADAVRASWTVPGLFQPVLREGRYLVDGSVVNPVPVSPCRAMGADVVIAVDVCSDLVGRFSRLKQGGPATPNYGRRLMSVLRPRQDAAPSSVSEAKALRQPSRLMHYFATEPYRSDCHVHLQALVSCSSRR